MKISIITVCFNAGKTIERTVQSALSQSYINIEYIVIDGESSDETIEILQRYKNEIDIFVSQKDQGIYDAMNKGIDLATGDLLYFLNADDYFVDAEVVQDVANIFMQEECSIVYGKINFVDIPEHLQANMSADLWKFNASFKSARELLAQRISQQNFFVKRGVFSQVGNFNIDYYVNADFDWMLRCIHYKIPIFFMSRFFSNLSFGGLSYKKRYSVLLNKIWIVFKNVSFSDFLHFFYHGVISFFKDISSIIKFNEKRDC